MAGVLQLVASFPSTTGMTSDITQNVIHLKVSGADPTPGSDLTAAMEAMKLFYISVLGGNTTSMDEWMSSDIDHGANACRVDSYFTNDLTGATPFGSPLASLGFTLGPPTSSAQLPEEVAIALSFHGDLTDVPVTEPNPTPPPATIRPAQRRRGRLFFGPLSQGAGFATGGHYRPSALLMDELGEAFGQTCRDIETSTPWNVGVWSRADAEVWIIVGGWVDDAWDTQRRRGIEPTTRDFWSV